MTPLVQWSLFAALVTTNAAFCPRYQNMPFGTTVVRSHVNGFSGIDDEDGRRITLDSEILEGPFLTSPTTKESSSSSSTIGSYLDGLAGGAGSSGVMSSKKMAGPKPPYSPPNWVNNPMWSSYLDGLSGATSNVDQARIASLSAVGSYLDKLSGSEPGEDANAKKMMEGTLSLGLPVTSEQQTVESDTEMEPREMASPSAGSYLDNLSSSANAGQTSAATAPMKSYLDNLSSSEMEKPKPPYEPETEKNDEMEELPLEERVVAAEPVLSDPQYVDQWLFDENRVYGEETEAATDDETDGMNVKAIRVEMTEQKQPDEAAEPKEKKQVVMEERIVAAEPVPSYPQYVDQWLFDEKGLSIVEAEISIDEETDDVNDEATRVEMNQQKPPDVPEAELDEVEAMSSDELSLKERIVAAVTEAQEGGASERSYLASRVEPAPAEPEETGAPEEMEALSLEERIVAAVSEAKGIGASEGSYISAREILRDSRSRTQRQLSRSAYERERAAEKVANIRAKAEAEARLIEHELKAKLDDTQAKIDAEVARIVEVLRSEIQTEAYREGQIMKLMGALQECVASKEYDIANEEKITIEMIDVRSKLEPGVIAQNLEELLDRKQTVSAIETDLVADLFDCLVELEIILDDARARVALMEMALHGLARPETRSSTPYEWKDIEKMEILLEQAAENVATSEQRIRELSVRVDDALVARTIILGEDVPHSLAKAAQRRAARRLKDRVMSLPPIKIDAEDFLNLQERDEKDLLAMLAKSVGSAAVGGSKAALFGVKAVFDTVTGKPVTEATSRMLNEVKSDASKQGETTHGRIEGTLRSTASVLDNMGKAGGTMAESFVQTESAQIAGEALKETSKDLVESVKSAAALSLKLFDTYKKRVDDINVDAKAKAKARERIGLAGGFKRLMQDRVEEMEAEKGPASFNSIAGSGEQSKSVDAEAPQKGDGTANR